MSEDAKAPLRWVRYDGIYYAALLVPPEEGPVEVPAGHSFVFFLDGESGAVVPDTDVEPYDPADSIKTSHPAAAAGVALAAQILYGNQDAAAQGRGVAAATAAGDVAGDARRRRGVLDDDEDDALEVVDAEEDDENLLQMFTREAAHDEAGSTRDKSDGSQSNRSTGDAPSQRPRKAKREEREDKRRRHHKHHSSRSASEEGSPAEQPDANLFAQPVNWSTMEEEYMTGMPPHATAAPPNGGDHRTHRHGRDAKAAGDMSSALSALHARGSLAMPYVAEVRHYYNVVLEEASAEGKVVSVAEIDVVRALERKLREVQAKAAYLERLHERRVGQSTVLSNAERRDADAALQEALRHLQDTISVETLVRTMVHTVAANPPSHEVRPRRHSRAERLAFHDASTAFLLQSTITTATPRELTQELANKYRDQRLHRDRVLSCSQGLGKTGLYGVAPKLMEHWSRARELMVLAQPQENQLVKPAGYVARRFADSITKVSQYALKRLSASSRHPSQGGRQHGTDGLGAFASPDAQSFLAGGLSAGVAGGNSTVADLLLSYQSQTRRNRQSYPAYYNFHDLHSDQAEQDAMLYRTSTGAPGATTTTAGTLVDHFLDEPSLSIVPEGHEPLITPLQGNFDPQVDFAIDPKEVREGRGGGDAELSITASYLPSTSLRMPSQESQLYSVLSAATSDADGVQGRSNASYSRASSVASSALYSEGGGSQGRLRRSRRHARRLPAAPLSSAAGSANGSSLSWRDAAKRAILEQLTLYLRGLKGRPAVLTEDDFETVARRLLERAVRRESEQTGVSMALQANNMTMPFDKKTRASLKRSVDNYVQRHYLASEVNSSARPGSQPYYRQPGEVPLPQPPEEDVEESAKMHREADDAPVYDA